LRSNWSHEWSHGLPRPCGRGLRPEGYSGWFDAPAAITCVGSTQPTSEASAPRTAAQQAPRSVRPALRWRPVAARVRHSLGDASGRRGRVRDAVFARKEVLPSYLSFRLSGLQFRRRGKRGRGSAGKITSGWRASTASTRTSSATSPPTACCWSGEACSAATKPCGSWRDCGRAPYAYTTKLVEGRYVSATRSTYAFASSRGEAHALDFGRRANYTNHRRALSEGP
jgi:hypothetical protein